MSKVIVLGSINMDVVAYTKRHPKNGETIHGDSLKYFPGGKGANQAVAAKKLGADALLVGKVGKDAFGETLRHFLNDQKVETHITVAREGIPTGTALITVASETGDNTIVAVLGANSDIKKEDISDVPINSGDVIVGQFEIPTEITEEMFKKGKQLGATNIFNAAPGQKISDKLLSLIDILVINETELELISGEKINAENIESVISGVKKIKNVPNIVVTLGARGSLALISNEVFEITGHKVKAIDSTGAGDCFVGAVASQISKGVSLLNAIKFANTAAAISVTRVGAGPSMPTLEEVTAFK